MSPTIVRPTTRTEVRDPASAGGRGAPPPRPQVSPVVNAMTVDVEDYFHVQAFAPFIRPEDWDGMPSRVETNTRGLLDIFDGAGVRATFFVLGWVAERFPHMVRDIADRGHEVASHGWRHVQVFRQTPEAFREDVHRTRTLLEDLSGTPVTGYRAATFSIGRQTPWAHAVLREAGYRYSSSIYPIRHDLYGMPEAPRFAFAPAGGDGVVEVPVTTVEALGRKLPCGGGGYFRLLPYAVSKAAMRRVNRRDGRPCIFYCHPWEIDPGQPRQRQAGARSAFRHYVNLHRMADRLRALMRDFAWDRMDRAFAADIDGT